MSNKTETSDFERMLDRAAAKREAEQEKVRQAAERRVAAMQAVMAAQKVRIDYARADDSAFNPRASMERDMQRLMREADVEDGSER